MNNKHTDIVPQTDCVTEEEQLECAEWLKCIAEDAKNEYVSDKKKNQYQLWNIWQYNVTNWVMAVSLVGFVGVLLRPTTRSYIYSTISMLSPPK